MPPQQSKQPDFIPAASPDFIPADSGSAPPATDTRNGLQRAFDTATTVTPEQEQGHSWLTNKAQEFGAGAIGTLSPLVHPLKTLEGIGNTLAHPIDSLHADVDNARAHPAQFLGNLAGGAALGGIAEEIPGGGGVFGTPKGPGTLGKIANAIPTRAKAGAIFNDLGTKLANTPVNLTNSSDVLQRLAEIDATGPAMPTTANKLLNRSQMVSPMNYPEARLFQENLSNPSVLEKQGMGGSMKGGIKQLKPAFYKDIRDAAETQGMGNDFDKAMTMYRRAATMNDMAKGVGMHVGKMAGTAALGGAGYGLYKAFQGDR